MLLIMGVLASIAISPLRVAIQKAKVAKAIGDIKAIQTDLMGIESSEQPLPGSLSAIGRGGVLDPWGQPYVYYPFPTPVVGIPGGSRTDRFSVNVNNTFDLYSLGPDGSSALPLTAGSSQDDIVRANNGGYVGLGSKY